METTRKQLEDDFPSSKQKYKPIQSRSHSTTTLDNDSPRECEDSTETRFVSNNNLNFRKTTAEMISEARTLLLGASNSGVRLVSTHRPITPREPRRQLYGKAGPPGRPPSAFCLRYLQSEVRNLPALEPIPIPAIDKEQNLTSRSRSVGPRLDVFDLKLQRKLPALPQRVKTPSQEDADKTRKGSVGRFSRKRDNSRSSSKEADDTSPETLIEAEVENNISTSGINILSSRKLFTRNYDLLAQSSTETLTEMLKQHAGIKDCTEETVQHINAILLELYNRIKTTHGSWRCALLGGLYGLVECSSPKILLAVARVVLGLRVTGSNLTGACKLVFKVARNEANDNLFHETDVPELLIDGLGRASPLDEPEACIYGYGTVRFLTSASQRYSDVDAIDFNRNEKFWESKNDLPAKPSTAPARDTTITTNQFRNHRQNSLKQVSIAQRLSKHGAVQLMVLHLQMLNEAGAIQKLSGPPLHSLYQLSAALRALAGSQQTTNLQEDNARAKSAKVRATMDRLSQYFGEVTPEEDYIHLELACPHLIKAAEISIGELEIQANIIRTLSVLSENPKCCEALSQFTGKIGMLLGPCQEKFSDSPDKRLSILSRLGYILGNIMARFDSARTQFYYNDVAMEYLCDALQFYSNQKLSLQNQMGDSVMDVLIKLIRVLANMSVNAEVGEGLGSKQGLGSILLHVLRTTSQIKVKGLNPETQELLNATLGALHNLCFYQDQISAACIDSSLKDLSNEGSVRCILVELGAILCQILKCGQDFSRIEAARVLGNLTRNQMARESFCETGGVQIIVQCFGSPDYDLKTSAVGVLVNLLGDWENRPKFMEMKGPIILGDMLRRFLTQEDWLVSGIICQAFWNLLIDANNVVNVLGEDQTDTLSDILAEYLDEQQLFRGSKPDTMWEQFALVATDLLERIQMNMSSPFHSFGDNLSESDEDDVHIEEIPEERLD